jgi:hypothetical protein
MKASLGPRCRIAMLMGKTATNAKKKAVLIQLMVEVFTS